MFPAESNVIGLARATAVVDLNPFGKASPAHMPATSLWFQPSRLSIDPIRSLQLFAESSTSAGVTGMRERSEKKDLHQWTRKSRFVLINHNRHALGFKSDKGSDRIDVHAANERLQYFRIELAFPLNNPSDSFAGIPTDLVGSVGGDGVVQVAQRAHACE